MHSSTVWLLFPLHVTVIILGGRSESSGGAGINKVPLRYQLRRGPLQPRVETKDEPSR